MTRRRYIKSAPGDRDWGDFCEWIRTYLYVEPDTGLVCYRPRDGTHFGWSADPDMFAIEWNAGSAGRPLQVSRPGRPYAYVTVDGCHVMWKSVRAALGLVDKADPNRHLPHPKDMTDAEIVNVYGLGYALMRLAMLRKREAAEREKFEAAVARYEAKIGRTLAAHEKELAKAAAKVV